MKHQKSILLFLLAIASLLAIGGVVFTSILKNQPKKEAPKEESRAILGESTAALNSLIEKTVQDAKEKIQEVVSGKAIEAQKTILNTAEKEVGNLTKSQIEALKLQICKDWGVIKKDQEILP